MNTIAVGTDGSDTAAVALDAAIDLAETTKARLVVVSAYRPLDKGKVRTAQDGAPDDVQWAINPHMDVDAILEHAAETARARDVEVSTKASEGNPADVLCDHAAAEGADVIVLGNKGIERRVLGSVPSRVANRAPCTVMIVKTT